MAGCGGKKKMEAGGLAKAAKRARKLNDDISTRKGFKEKLNRKPGAGMGMLGGARPMAPGGKERMVPPLRERQAASAMEEARKQSQKPARRKAGGMLKTPDNPGLKKLPTEVRNKMGYMKKGGKVKKGYHMMPDGKMMKDSDHKKKMKKGGKVYCKDGCAVRGKTRGKLV